MNEAFSNQLTSSGHANRWNYDDQFMIYTGSSRSLSSLELIVHENAVSPAFNYKVLVISIANDDNLYTQIFQADLPLNWRNAPAYRELQPLGSRWYENNQSLVLKVPSAVIPKEYNYIINVKHPAFDTSVSLVRTEDYFWDERLL